MAEVKHKDKYRVRFSVWIDARTYAFDSEDAKELAYRKIEMFIRHALNTCAVADMGVDDIVEVEKE